MTKQDIHEQRLARRLQITSNALHDQKMHADRKGSIQKFFYVLTQPYDDLQILSAFSNVSNRLRR